MISVEEARANLASAKADHAASTGSAWNERERCRMAVIRAEDVLAAAEHQQRTVQAVHPEIDVEHTPTGVAVHMGSVEFVELTAGELLTLGEEFCRIARKRMGLAS